MYMLNELKKKKSVAELRKFGFILGGALIVLSVLLLILGRTGSPRLLSLLGCILVGFAFFAPNALAPFEWGWTKLGNALGSVVTRIILVVFFFLVMTPVALVARLSGKRFLELGFRDPSRKTYWNTRNDSEQDASEFERQF